MAIDQRRLRQVRDLVIRYIYENAADRHFVVPEDEVAPAISATRQEVDAAIRLMHSQGMFGNSFTYIGSYGLSERGQIEAERLDTLIPLREPEAPHSITVNATYSIVQVAGRGSSQSAAFQIDQSRIESVLHEIEQKLPTLPLEESKREQANGLVTALRNGIAAKIGLAGLQAIGGALSSLLASVGSKLGERLGESLNISL